MRILLMGTSRFAVPILRATANAGHEIVAVVTQPDRPSGRGRGVHVSPIKEEAVALGLPVFQPEKIRAEDAVQQIRNYEPIDAIVVAAFGQIVPQVVLDIPRLGSINVHASLLPKYRGAAPIHHAIMAGEKVTGVTTMLMDAGLDTGDTLQKRTVSIRPAETTGELEVHLAEAGAELIVETLELVDRGEITPEPQDDSQATVAKSLKREQGEIDWRKSAEEIVNLIRAMSPRPGAYTRTDDAELKVWKAAAEPKLNDREQDAFAPGHIVAIAGDEVIVAAGSDYVRLYEVQPQNRKRMNAGEFARGARGLARFLNPDTN